MSDLQSASDLASSRAVGTVERVSKPWGHEEIFAIVEGHFVGKVLYVRAAESLSLQYHENKYEVLTPLQGRISVELGTAFATGLDRYELSAGDSLHIPPGLRHRITALVDSTVIEASTADPGWREDVVRLEDRYGRAGSSEP